MVDHVPNLLLNETSNPHEEHRWRVDPTFYPLSLSSSVAGVRDLFMEGADTRYDREERVFEALPFVYSPDFRYAWGAFDRRRTFSFPESGSVFTFYGTMRHGSDWVSNISRSELSARMFATLQPNEDGIADMMSRLGGVYSGSTEMVRRASAVLLGYLVMADWEYRRRASRLGK